MFVVWRVLLWCLLFDVWLYVWGFVSLSFVVARCVFIGGWWLLVVGRLLLVVACCLLLFVVSVVVCCVLACCLLFLRR